MTGTGSNIYAKQYLVNYRLVSSSEKRRKQRCNKESSVKSNHNEELFLEDMNKNSDCRLEEYRSHSDKSSYDSQLTKSISNLGNTTELVQAVSKKRLHYKDDVPIKEPKTKKVKHDCFELEEVNDTGQCSEVNSDDAIEHSDEDKNEDISDDMEMFNDLTENIDYAKWLAKVVAHDHDYYGQRVRFGGVTVWYFARHQYSSSVPSEGDVGLGMEMKHLHREHHDIDKSDSDHISFSHKLKGRRKNRPGRLKPLSMSARVSILRSHGIYQIDRGESADIENLQASRAVEGGCDCVDECVPDTCTCIINQVECEVDIEGYPCKCSHSSCVNPEGRRVFNRKEVDMHRWTQVDFNATKFSLSSDSSDETNR